MTKTIVNAWSATAINLKRTERNNFWGIGDLLRGSNVLYDVAQSIGAEFVVDLHGHPLGQLFEPQDLGRTWRTKNIAFWKFKGIDHAKYKISRCFLFHKQLLINTNGGPSWPLKSADPWREQVLNAMQPGADLRDFLNKFLPSEPYSVLHLRMGDAHFRQDGEGIEKALAIIEANKQPGDILLCDRSDIKSAAATAFPDLNMSQATPVHVGTSTDQQGLMQTMGDFFLLGQAEKIKSYSTYSWTSGFVVSASRLFDVPVHLIGHDG